MYPMYDIIENLLDHSWQSNYTSDQQYIYYIAGTVIVILTVWLLDFINCLIRSSAGKR